MPAASLLTLLDDIASTLDDVALLTKVAAQKTSGVLGDDLALNAQQVSGVNADRELPVVWAVAKGSIINKAILVPAAILISSFMGWLVTPLLMLGGLFLCFEGFEKVFAKLFHPPEEKPVAAARLVEVVDEKAKIKGAVRTDFILSAEIIVITLGTVVGETLTKQILVLCGIAVVMTIGVYGLVAVIVKLDDFGLYLNRENASRPRRYIGQTILKLAPMLMKFLGVAGTAAMFLVGGGILVHGIEPLHHYFESLHPLLSIVANLVAGVLAGGLALLTIDCAMKVKKLCRPT